MLNNYTRSLLLMALLHGALLQASTAQTTAPAPADTAVAAPQWALSVNAGIALPYTDVATNKSLSPVVGIGAGYYATTFLHFNLDVQKGWLKSGADITTTAAADMGSKNSYFAASLTARFLPFGLLKNAGTASKGLNILAGFYGGIGVGLISSSVQSNTISSTDYGSIGDYSGTSLMLPVETGINVPLLLMTHNRRLLLNANVRANLCFSDKIDGYTPTITANKKNDAFDTFTIGLVYNF